MALLALVDGVRCDLDADGGEHGLQGEEDHVRFCGLQLVIEHGDGHLSDGGGDLGGGERRRQVEGGGGVVLGLEDALAIGGDSEAPEQNFGE
jgi:hypothetical protein